MQRRSDDEVAARTIAEVVWQRHVQATPACRTHMPGWRLRENQTTSTRGMALFAATLIRPWQDVAPSFQRGDICRRGSLGQQPPVCVDSVLCPPIPGFLSNDLVAPARLPAGSPLRKHCQANALCRVFSRLSVLLVRGPERQIVAEQLHDEGGVLVGVLCDVVELGDRVLESGARRLARLVRIPNHLV